MDTQIMTPVIAAINLQKVFGKKTVLNRVSLDVYPGEYLGIFGLRATGKTTLLHMLAGLERCKTGVIKVMGYDISENDTYKASVGLVTQARSLFQDLRAGENLDFIANLKGARPDRITPLVEKFDLQDHLQQAVNGLDAGVYQRLALACALLNAPQLLILDEPIKDIDLYSRNIIAKVLQEFVSQGGACVCGFSNMEFAAQMNKVGWLDNGELTVYEPQEAVARWKSLIHSYNNRNGEKDG